MVCRKVQPKRDLMRLVKTAEGDIEIDSSGKKPGRGAYLCRALECWEKGLGGDRLEHALRGRLAAERREQLICQVRELLKGAD